MSAPDDPLGQLVVQVPELRIQLATLSERIGALQVTLDRHDAEKRHLRDEVDAIKERQHNLELRWAPVLALTAISSAIVGGVVSSFLLTLGS